MSLIAFVNFSCNTSFWLVFLLAWLLDWFSGSISLLTVFKTCWEMPTTTLGVVSCLLGKLMVLASNSMFWIGILEPWVSNKLF